MTLSLRYKINEGVNMTEDFEDGRQESLEFIVRDIIRRGDMLGVKIEIYKNGEHEFKEVYERDEGLKITPSCYLRVPKDPLKTDASMEPKKSYRGHRKFKIDKSKSKMLLDIDARRSVEISQRRMYDLEGKILKKSN